MPIRNRFLIIALLITALAFTTAFKIKTDHDKKEDFSVLKTYNWLPEPDTKTGDPRIDDNSVLAQTIKDAVENEFAEKGFTKQTVGKPDFLVGWHGSIDQKMDKMTLDNYYGYGPGGWGVSVSRPATPGMAETYERAYEQGTLVIDIVDPKDEELIWRGSASGAIKEKATPEERQKNIAKAIDEILKKFPPKKK